MQEVEKMDKNKIKFKTSVSNVKCCGLFHIVFVPNRYMPLGGEH